MGHCPLCVAIAGGAAIVEGETSVALLDKYPLSPGHCLILPRRHVPLFWDLSRSELAALFDLVSEAKAVVDERFQPGGYNIGVNVGEVAGQIRPSSTSTFTLFRATPEMIPTRVAAYAGFSPNEHCWESTPTPTHERAAAAQTGSRATRRSASPANRSVSSAQRTCSPWAACRR
jgi:galactose-1-phosphate uridylyltransferase